MPAALKHWTTLSGSARVSQEAYGERFLAGKGTATWELVPALHPRGFNAEGTADRDQAGAAGSKSQGGNSEYLRLL